MKTTKLLQPKPPGFDDHNYEFTITIPSASKYVWKWLNNPDTFTKTQVWPYRVEFYSPDPANIPNGFHKGVLTNHTGPLVNFSGELTSIEDQYRDLQYFYGSYAIQFNWIRPYRLEFWTKEVDGITALTCRISSYVKPGTIYKLWNSSQKLFWGRFKNWATKSVRKIERENS